MLYKLRYKQALECPLRLWLFGSIRIVFEIISDGELTCPVGQKKFLLILSDFWVLLVPDNRTSVTVESCKGASVGLQYKSVIRLPFASIFTSVSRQGT